MIVDANILTDSARQFASREYSFDARQKSVRAEGGAVRRYWSQFAELGWLGAALPEECGGIGGSIAETNLILEELGKALVAEPLLGCAVLAPQVLLRAAIASEHHTLLGEIVDGSVIVSLAHEEDGARGCRDHVRVCAEQRDDHLQLTGRKLSVLGAPDADKLIVSVRRDGDLALVLVDAKAEGIEMETYTGYDGLRAANVVFEDFLVPNSAVIATGEDAQAALNWGLDQFLMASGAVEIGVMQAALEITRDYLKTRKQFGSTLAEFQVLQHRLVDMYIAIEEARALLGSRVAIMQTSGKVDAAMLASMTYRMRLSGRFVANQSVQLHGGIGMTDEYFVGHCCRYLVAAGLRSGDALRDLDIIGARGAA